MRVGLVHLVNTLPLLLTITRVPAQDWLDWRGRAHDGRRLRASCPARASAERRAELVVRRAQRTARPDFIGRSRSSRLGSDGGSRRRAEDCIDGEEPPLDALIHRWSFDGTGVNVVDSIGGANGTVEGGADARRRRACSRWPAIVMSSPISTSTCPTGLISGLSQVTILAWTTWQGGAGYQRIFDFGISDMGEQQGGSGRSHIAVMPSTGFANGTGLGGSSQRLASARSSCRRTKTSRTASRSSGSRSAAPTAWSCSSTASRSSASPPRSPSPTSTTKQPARRVPLVEGPLLSRHFRRGAPLQHRAHRLPAPYDHESRAGRALANFSIFSMSLKNKCSGGPSP